MIDSCLVQQKKTKIFFLPPIAIFVNCRFAWEADSLLDLACGRGGDIWKWIDCQIKYVKGIDLSPGEVAEAKQRFEETQKQLKPGQPRVTRCEFEDSPNLGIKEWKEPQQYDVVTCMFALHYFFVSETALKQFFHNVSINLKEGGYFIGTVPDAKRINECIFRSKKSVFDSPMLRIEARWQGTAGAFGSAYVCAIGDTVTGGEFGTEGSREYLVYSTVLQNMAAQFGLKPVVDYKNSDLEEMFDKEDKEQVMKHFKPDFPGSDPSLETASALFTAFAFQKTSGEVTLPDNSASCSAGGASSGGGGGALKRKIEDSVVEVEKKPQNGQQQQQEEQVVKAPVRIYKKPKSRSRPPPSLPAAATDAPVHSPPPPV